MVLRIVVAVKILMVVLADRAVAAVRAVRVVRAVLSVAAGGRRIGNHPVMMVVRYHAVYQYYREAEQQQYGYGSFPVHIKRLLNSKYINKINCISMKGEKVNLSLPSLPMCISQ